MVVWLAGPTETDHSEGAGAKVSTGDDTKGGVYLDTGVVEEDRVWQRIIVPPGPEFDRMDQSDQKMVERSDSAE